MEKATFTRGQQSLIALAIIDYRRQMDKLATDLDAIKETDKANERRSDASLLQDAYWKITLQKEWKVEK